MDDHPNHPWQIVAPVLLVALPIIAGACVCVYAQLYWPYNEPNRLTGKDHEDQHEGGIAMREDDHIVVGSSRELTRRSASGISRAEEGWDDPDAITALPRARTI